MALDRRALESLTVLAPPTGAHVDRDLVYRTDRYGALRLDVYRPPGDDRPRPVDFHLAARATIPYLNEPWYC